MNQGNYKPEGGLLQSSAWMAVLRAEGKRTITIETLDGQIFGIIERLPIVGQYVYVPRLGGVKSKSMEQIIVHAKKHACAWVRIDAHAKSTITRLQKTYRVVRAPHDMQPRKNFIIDLTKDEETIMHTMKAKVRYNIRLAEKKGVTTYFVTYGDENFAHTLDVFYALVKATAKRKGVIFHTKEHYHMIFRAMTRDTVALFVAEYNGDIIATNIVTFYAGTATYLHGATSDRYRNVMAPFLLQWRAICIAKARNCTRYDFGGVFPTSEDAGKRGITRFKQGFAPQQEPAKTYGSFDIVIAHPQYALYHFLQKIKSWI